VGTWGKRKRLPSDAFMDCTHQGKRNFKPTVSTGPEQVTGDHHGKPSVAKYRSDCQSFVLD